jgi:hypothetical protein
MTPERLAEIQTHADRWSPALLAETSSTSVIRHRAELLAEVRRLTDELAEARTLARAFRTAHHDDQPDDDLSLLLPAWLTEESAS